MIWFVSLSNAVTRGRDCAQTLLLLAHWWACLLGSIRFMKWSSKCFTLSMLSPGLGLKMWRKTKGDLCAWDTHKGRWLYLHNLCVIVIESTYFARWFSAVFELDVCSMSYLSFAFYFLPETPVETLQHEGSTWSWGNEIRTRLCDASQLDDTGLAFTLYKRDLVIVKMLGGLSSLPFS